MAIGVGIVLILGISEVFRITSKTIGIGQATLVVSADQRSSLDTFKQDIEAIAADDMPFLIIRNQRVSAFWDAQDLSTDRDFNPAATALAREAQILTKPNQDGLETATSAWINTSGRSYRLDQLSMFAVGRFARQTGEFDAVSGTETLNSRLTSNEGWLNYGHLQLPSNPQVINDDTFLATDPANRFYAPGEGDPTYNRTNFFASQWVLGRSIHLLTPVPIDEDGQRVSSFEAGVYDPEPTSLDTLESPMPFQATRVNVNNEQLQWSTVDVIATSIAEARVLLSGHEAVYKTLQQPGDDDFDWWTPAVPRFYANQQLSRPLDRRKLALYNPVFIPNCSQIIVEFAGDYATQVFNNRLPKTSRAIPASLTPGSNWTAVREEHVATPLLQFNNDATVIDESDVNLTSGPVRYGDVISDESDGFIDVVCSWTDIAGNQVGTPRVRWFGAPRDLNGDGVIQTYRSGVETSDLVDVVPVRDFIRSGHSTNSSWRMKTDLNDFPGRSFERFQMPRIGGDEGELVTWDTPSNGNYANPAGYTDGDFNRAVYTAAFGPDDAPLPSLIRITLIYRDPNGRIGSGETTVIGDDNVERKIVNNGLKREIVLRVPRTR